jgi:hypothetical protein
MLLHDAEGREIGCAYPNPCSNELLCNYCGMPVGFKAHAAYYLVRLFKPTHEPILVCAFCLSLAFEALGDLWNREKVGLNY